MMPSIPFPVEGRSSRAPATMLPIRRRRRCGQTSTRNVGIVIVAEYQAEGHGGQLGPERLESSLAPRREMRQRK